MTTGPVREKQAIIAGMAPVLDDRNYRFCTGVSPGLAKAALATFAKDEGLSTILPEAVARTPTGYRPASAAYHVERAQRWTASV